MSRRAEKSGRILNIAPRRVEVALGVAISSGVLLPGSALRAAPQSDGFAELHERLGDEAPTGAGVGVGMAEAPNGSGNFYPNESNFPDQTIIEMSGSGGDSGHANGVLNQIVGGDRAFGVTQVWAWEAINWLEQYLNFNGPAPDFPPASLRVFNHSWVATGADVGVANQLVRRMDFAINRDDTVYGVGTNNGAFHPFLLSAQFNGLTVGPGHTPGATTPGNGHDGPGRMKPDIHGIANTSSNATGRVSAVATVLIETATMDPVISGNPDADEPPVIKAAMLAGCTRSEEWTNNPAATGPGRGVTSRPLDEASGAGFVNVNLAHLILTAGEQDGSSSVPASVNADARGWSREVISSGSSRFWRFQITELVPEVVILATWPRYVASNFITWNLMNVDLTLWRIGKNGALSSLVGDAGLPYFTSGNVVSESDVDNVELIVVRDLEPGEYVFEVKRQVGASTQPIGVAWIMPETAPPGIPADLNGDGTVGGADLALLLAAWGDTVGPADLNGDGIVGGADLAVLLAAWGDTVP